MKKFIVIPLLVIFASAVLFMTGTQTDQTALVVMGIIFGLAFHKAPAVPVLLASQRCTR